jgi:NodT family efflux transporter outer membrane factor (OMF) lipoprotein
VTRAAATLVAAAALMLHACGGAPPGREIPDLDIDTPGAWTAAGSDTMAEGPSSPPTLAWWTAFSDPGLEAVVARALERNHDLAAASARLEEAAALARVAGADLYPQVQAALNASRSKQNFVGFPIPGGGDVLTSYSTSYTADLRVSWELDLWGRVRNARSAAGAEAQAAAADWYGARLSLAARAAGAWFALTEARSQVALAERTVSAYEETERQVEDRFRRGVRTSLVLRRARSSRAGAEAQLRARLQALDAAARGLEILLGDYPAGRAAGADSLPALPGPVPANLPAELVARRPDLVAAERRLAASGARAASAKAALYPRISLTASGGTSSNELKDLLDEDFSVWSLLGNLTAPLFQGGRLRGNLDAARAREDQTLHAFASAALGAYAEVEQALAAETLLRERLVHQTEAAHQAVAARDVAAEQYRSGLIDFIDVLDAQRSALAAESQLLAVKRALLDNRIGLHLALGGDFAAHAPEPGVPPGPEELEGTSP